IVSLHSTNPVFPIPVAEEMLRRSLSNGSTSGWWIDDKNVYQVVLQRFYEGAQVKGTLLGTVVVGRSMDARAAGAFGRITSSQVLFRYGQGAVVSTLSALREQEVLRQFQDEPTREQVYIENERFLVSSVDLTPGPSPAAKLIILK